MPALHRVHLLRGLPQPSKEPGDADISKARLVLLAMRAADRQRDPAGVARLSRNGLQQQRPAGDRLAPMVRISQTHEQAPPVVNEGNAAGEQAAALQSCVVNPPQPHWFFNSSNPFSQSARPRYS